jgi:hypothetical protein
VLAISACSASFLSSALLARDARHAPTLTLTKGGRDTNKEEGEVEEEEDARGKEKVFRGLESERELAQVHSRSFCLQSHHPHLCTPPYVRSHCFSSHTASQHTNHMLPAPSL